MIKQCECCDKDLKVLNHEAYLQNPVKIGNQTYILCKDCKETFEWAVELLAKAVENEKENAPAVTESESK